MPFELLLKLSECSRKNNYSQSASPRILFQAPCQTAQLSIVVLGPMLPVPTVVIALVLSKMASSDVKPELLSGYEKTSRYTWPIRLI